MNLSLANKITVLFSLGLALVSSILISLFSSEVNRRYCDLLIERGRHTVNELVLNTDRLLELGLQPHELVGYEILLNKTMNKTEGILYLAFLDVDGSAYFEAGSVPKALSQLPYFEAKPIKFKKDNEFIIQIPIPKHAHVGGSITAILDKELIEKKTMEVISATLPYAVLVSFFSILVVILYLRSNLGEPLKRLVSRIQRVDLNDIDQKRNQLSLRHDEIGVVARTFDAMLHRLSFNQVYLAQTNKELVLLTRELEDRVEQRTQELERVNQQLQSLAHIDMLTGLLNRHCLEEVLQARFDNAKRNNQLFAILMMDLDRFKAVNDVHGHVAGDKALSVIGERIRSGLRYGDRVFRYGGDEFVFIFDDYADNTSLITIIKKIQEVILQPVIFEGVELDFGLSIGVASTAYCNTCTVQELIINADQAMYEAKKDDQFFVFSNVKQSKNH